MLTSQLPDPWLGFSHHQWGILLSGIIAGLIAVAGVAVTLAVQWHVFRAQLAAQSATVETQLNAQRDADVRDRIANLLERADRAVDLFPTWNQHRRPDQYASTEEQARSTGHLEALRSLGRDTRHHAQYIELTASQNTAKAAEVLSNHIEAFASETDWIWAMGAGGMQEQKRSDEIVATAKQLRHALLDSAPRPKP
ncbi:hypothetical protein OOZ51_03520 [Arthrobacter sp. MI7-26]|uniref:hypothetical protein n=1 Tax=Arthrobacter sp. MI7-26 TaxID=2993653 RepID=UPI002249A245|nr:hypothetical protein [Arthrobacter sp. MI7-26]MCX2746882.1 hypothetical protein [Arthrobacter sp. MI7-26]